MIEPIYPIDAINARQLLPRLVTIHNLLKREIDNL